MSLQKSAPVDFKVQSYLEKIQGVSYEEFLSTMIESFDKFKSTSETIKKKYLPRFSEDLVSIQFKEVQSFPEESRVKPQEPENLKIIETKETLPTSERAKVELDMIKTNLNKSSPASSLNAKPVENPSNPKPSAGVSKNKEFILCTSKKPEATLVNAKTVASQDYPQKPLDSMEDPKKNNQEKNCKNLEYDDQMREIREKYKNDHLKQIKAEKKIDTQPELVPNYSYPIEPKTSYLNQAKVSEPFNEEMINSSKNVAPKPEPLPFLTVVNPQKESKPGTIPGNMIPPGRKEEKPHSDPSQSITKPVHINTEDKCVDILKKIYKDKTIDKPKTIINKPTHINPTLINPTPINPIPINPTNRNQSQIKPDKIKPASIKNQKKEEVKVARRAQLRANPTLSYLRSLGNEAGLIFDEMSYENLLELDRHNYDKGNGFDFDTLTLLNQYPFEERNQDATTCNVCQDIIENGQNVSCLKCSHVFHFDCIYEWLTRKKKCPHSCEISEEDFYN